MAKRRTPADEQLGFGFETGLLQAERPADTKGTADVPEADRGVLDALPARPDGGADQRAGLAAVRAGASDGNAGEPPADRGAIADAAPEYERDAAESGSGSDGARDVHASRVEQAEHAADRHRTESWLTPSSSLGATAVAIEPPSARRRKDAPQFPNRDEPDFGQIGFVFDQPAEPTPPANPQPTIERQPSHRFRLDERVIAPPSGLRAKATIDALYVLKYIEAEGLAATDEQQQILAGFSGFGALANHIFPEPGTENYTVGWAGLGTELASLLTRDEYASAKRSTFNAFYTSPQVMGAMYAALNRMGVPSDGVTALEPGCGIGNFMGVAPSGMNFIGVEQEALSGRIAQALYPEHDIRIAPFQKVDLPAESVDVVIGNVPFADLTLQWQDRKLPLHDYFFAKSLHSLHEGGVLALVTSRYTLDKKDPTFRQQMADVADFLGAVRLPKGAFRQEGTEVVTDIIFLGKRGKARAPNHAADWLNTQPLPDSGVTDAAHCNRYFIEHPDMVVGTLTEARGMYRNRELTVPMPDDFGDRLQNAIEQLPTAIFSRPEEPRTTSTNPQPEQSRTPNPERTLPAGSICVGDDGYLRQVTNQRGESERLLRSGKSIHALTGTVGTRLAALVDLRDAARTVLETQRTGQPDAEKNAARSHLNATYDDFVQRFGAINKTNISVTSSGTTIRRQPNLTLFKDDPDAYLVMALEQYDESRDRAQKMPIMQRDVVGQTPPVQQVASALDGLLVCLNHHGRVEIETICQLYRASPEEIITELGNHIYFDPAQERYVTAEEYLSGNVREKLRIAQEQDDPKFVRNVTALMEAQPAPVPPGDIDVALGATWIPCDVIQNFVADLLQCGVDEIRVRHVEQEALWQVDCDAWIKNKVVATSTYGTLARSAITLINDSLNMRVPTVMKTIQTDEGERQVADQEATLAAREKQKAIKQRFGQWLFEEPKRADDLTARYNQIFNTTTLRSYNGSHLTFPTMNPDIELRQHQVDAVWRVMSNGNSLLAHAVGAGKTFEMIAAGMKMKQAGLIRKPLFVVPNHMLEQFSKEFYVLYPDATLLVASKEDLKKEKRMLMTAKAASGDWDGIIMTHSSFEKIGMSPDFQADFVRQQIDDYETLLTDMSLNDAEADTKRLIKRIEKKKEQWEQRLEDLLNLDRKDSGLTFEELGVDHLFVDEAHLFKNLETPTKMGHVAGVQTTGSLRAFDLFMKTRFLDAHGHGTTFATGTPVSNSMVEMYTMSRFLAPELLQERGISHFDGWAAVFGDIVDTVELSPDAQSLR